MSILILLIAAMLLHSAVAPGLPFTVYGYVHDEKGGTVPGASVTVESPIDSQTLATDSEGRYWVTISISGVGDRIKVTAAKGDARGESGGTVPSGTSNLRIDVTIVSPPTTTSATTTSTSLQTSKTTSTPSTTTSTPVTSTTTASVNPASTEIVSSTSVSTTSTAAATTSQSKASTATLVTTIAYTTTETRYEVSYQTSMITVTKAEAEAQKFSTIVFSVEPASHVESDAHGGKAIGITLVSNVNVGDLAYDENLNRLTMSISDSHGSPAVFEVRVPKLLIADPANVVLEVDGRPFGFKLTESSELYSLSFSSPPGQRLLSISFGSRGTLSNAGTMEASSSPGGTSPVSSLLVGVTVLVILLSVGRRFD